MTAKTNAKERSRSKSRARAEAEGILLADEDSDVSAVLTEEPGKMEDKEEEKEKETEHVESFTTGPKSVPTHWKQTVFLLREVVSVVEGMLFIRRRVPHFLLYHACCAPHCVTSCYIFIFSLPLSLLFSYVVSFFDFFCPLTLVLSIIVLDFVPDGAPHIATLCSFTILRSVSLILADRFLLRLLCLLSSLSIVIFLPFY
jgi:hypothetical protein